MEETAQQRSRLVPPHDELAERAVLTALMLDGDAPLEVFAMLEPGSFFKPGHGEIFAAMQGLFARGEPTDEVSVLAELRRRGTLTKAGGATALGELAEDFGSGANAKHHAQLVKRAELGRKLMQLSMRTLQRLTRGEFGEDVVSEHAAAALELTAVGGAKEPISARVLMRRTFEELQERHENQGKPVGLATGFADLDKRLGGLRKGALVIVAARPSMGKSAFAAGIVRHAATRCGASALVFSLEMTDAEIGERLLSAQSRVPNTSMSTGQFRSEDWGKMSRGMEPIAASKLFVDDTSSLGLTELRAKARMQKLRHGLDIVVVDYLQLMRGTKRSESREREIAEISRGLKELAKELSVPVVALSQLNRGLESRDDKRPKLSDMRESGAIEQDADVVLSVYRDEVYNPNGPEKGIAEIGVLKNRHGPTGGPVKVRWENAYSSFENLAAWGS